MTRFWGCDSLSACDSLFNGEQLANYVINTYYAGGNHDEIVFWGRFFDYGDGHSTWAGDSEADALSTAVRAYRNPSRGKSWIAPLAAPATITGSQSAGEAAGNRVCKAIAESLSSRLKLPGNRTLYVFLDVEPGETLGVSWWTGWSEAVRTHKVGRIAPFRPGAYLRKADSTTLNTVTHHGRCYAAWSQQPQPDCLAGGCNSPGPAWQSDIFPKPIVTAIWQYGEQNRCQGCRNNPPVDLDVTNPSVRGRYGYGVCDNMLYVPP